MDKEAIKSIYAEFVGFLSQLPLCKTPDDSTPDRSLWEQYNGTVTLLNKATGRDYSSYLIEPREGDWFVYLITFRMKLGGLINKLHTEYFSNEKQPFSGAPGLVITQSQQQNQSVTILLEVQSKIDEKLLTYKEGTKEHDFLKKLKSSLPTILNVTQLITTIARIASEFGVTPETIANMFS